MSKNIEQRICIKFCVKNEISASEALKMLQKCYGDETNSRATVFAWYKLFKEGRELVDDGERSGRPSTSKTEDNVNKVKELVLQNRRYTIRDIVGITGLSFGSIQTILKSDLGLRRVQSRLVPKTLNFFEKQRRVEMAEEMLSMSDNDLKNVITGDETWIYAYDVEVAHQSSEYRFIGEGKPKRPRRSRSKIKVMLTVFFDSYGVVHKEFLPTGQTVNKEYYLNVMRHLREAIRQKRPDSWKTNSWFLHHDNAPSHNALVIRQFLAKNSTNVVPQAPYSPDLSPCDFFLFSKLKYPLRGKRFETVDEIKQKSLEVLNTIPKIEYERCFEDWKKRFHKCIAVSGDYFEGDDINLDE